MEDYVDVETSGSGGRGGGSGRGGLGDGGGFSGRGYMTSASADTLPKKLMLERVVRLVIAPAGVEAVKVMHSPQIPNQSSRSVKKMSPGVAEEVPFTL